MKTLSYNLKHSTLSAIFADLENGNLSDAKKRAKRANSFRLSMFARQILCW
jgi:hypothetical protein